jgi:hypothetical protein
MEHGDDLLSGSVGESAIRVEGSCPALDTIGREVFEKDGA